LDSFERDAILAATLSQVGFLEVEVEVDFLSESVLLVSVEAEEKVEAEEDLAVVSLDDELDIVTLAEFAYRR
jgi:hypothetical protein